MNRIEKHFEDNGLPEGGNGDTPKKQVETTGPSFTHEAKEASRREGVMLKEIQVGATVRIVTRNSEYVFHKLDDGTYSVTGGIFGTEERHIAIHGSTFGGSAITGGQIKERMNLEMGIIGEIDKKSGTPKTVTISPVKEIYVFEESAAE